MGPGRGDRNQDTIEWREYAGLDELQWGPVVVTGIRPNPFVQHIARSLASMGSGRGDRNQGIGGPAVGAAAGFNGVRSW